MNRVALFTLVSVLSLGACKEKEKAADPPPLPAPVATPAPTAVATAAAAVAAPAAPETAGLPTSEDYEQQAIDQINPQNIDSELDKLEKEIGQ